jgi:hypothetical protein
MNWVKTNEQVAMKAPATNGIRQSIVHSKPPITGKIIAEM